MLHRPRRLWLYWDVFWRIPEIFHGGEDFCCFGGDWGFTRGVSIMKKFGTIWAIVFILGSSIAVAARPRAPAPLLPDRIPVNTHRVAGNTGCSDPFGDPSSRHPIDTLVKPAAGARIPSHTHPDARSSTVLAGTLYMSDLAKPSWNRKSSPCRQAGLRGTGGCPAYLWAKDGEGDLSGSGNRSDRRRLRQTVAGPPGFRHRAPVSNGGILLGNRHEPSIQ